MLSQQSQIQSQNSARAPGRARHRLWAVLFAGLAVGFLVQRFLVCFVVVHGESMAPSFWEGQVCLVKAASHNLTRGDVVIVHDGHSRSIKRIVGLPNESILFQNGKVFVNGQELREPYLERARRTWPVWQTRFTLSREHFFVMGDNRDRSEDSRVYGPLRGQAILGKVTL